MKLDPEFYLDLDVVTIARSLIGKVVFTKIGNQMTAGIITETEAYAGESDKASHAYGGRFTKRTSVMYQKGGVAYIYLCYGIHSLFNVVTGPAGTPHAVLIRSVIPFTGKEVMMKRRNISEITPNSFTGPGKVSQSLGIRQSQTGTGLNSNTIWIEDRKISIPKHTISSSPRIGIGYAEEDALLPYRFTTENISIFTQWKFSI